MVSANEAAEEYRTVLADLTRNDKTQINLLTILAEDYASYSSEIVTVIDDTLHKCPKPLKIVMLYVVDSILKNIKPENGGYRELFARKIVDMIVHVFKESDEKVRASIYRLRCTWADIFPRSRLYMMDCKINGIDKAWPIINPTATIVVPPAASPAMVHVNPRFLNGKPAAELKAPTSTATTKPEVVRPAKPKVRDEVAAVSSTTPEHSGLTVTIENDKKSNKKEAEEKKKKPSPTMKQEPMETEDGKYKEKEDGKGGGGGGKRGTKQQTPKTAERTRPVREKEERTTTAKRPAAGERSQRKDSGGGMGRAPRKLSQFGEQPPPKQRKPESLLSMRVNPPPMNQQQPQPQQQQRQGTPQPAGPPPRAHSPPAKRSRRTMPPPPMATTHQPMHRPPPPPNIPIRPLLGNQTKPTTAPGAHAFRLNAPPPATSMAPPPSLNMLNTSGSGPPPVQPQIPPMAVAATAPPTFFPQPSIPTPVIPPPQQQQHHIQNVTPRLPGVPENNRIFVDGKAYEVFYLEDAAVIERNGLPHRVSFAGPPRDVIIDGAAHRMGFGEQKQVLIDGDLHVLHFGAPSRELYMGNFPFKGAFGGPPIIATINGRRHEIRLCGPPPEVRIDPEPSYELMRYMPAIRQQQAPLVPKQEPKPEQPSIDVSKLLKRLKETGLLQQQPTEAERKQRERQAAIEAKNAAIASLNAAPIPSNHRLDNIERRATPMSGLDQFSMRSLIIRYDSIIDAIHRPRVVCQYCGIAFRELYSEAYQRHADWHLQNTIRMEDQKLNKGPKVIKGTKSQPWYMLDDWFDYSETELVNRSLPAGQDGDKSHGVDGDMDKGAAGSGGPSGAGGNRDATSDIVEMKECQVCHEQFEEYWDEDEDVWRLRDCVVVDGRAFHNFCKEDAEPTTTASSTSLPTTTSQNPASHIDDDDNDDIVDTDSRQL